MRQIDVFSISSCGIARVEIDNVNDNIKVLIFNVHFRNVYLAIY